MVDEDAPDGEGRDREGSSRGDSPWTGEWNGEVEISLAEVRERLPDLPSARTLGGVSLVVVLLLAAVLWFVRPWLHPLVYGLLYRSPGLLQWFVLAVGLGTAGLFAVESRPWVGRVLLGLAVVSALLTVAAPLVGAEYGNERLADEVQSQVTSLEEIPETTTDRPRILPQAVAAQYAQNSLQFPRHQLAGDGVTFLDGTPHWSYSLQPDGLVNTFVGKQAGAVFVNMSTQRKQVRVLEQEFDCGQGQLVTDDYLWQLRKSKYTVAYQDAFAVSQGGDLHLAIPYIRHAHRFRATPIPQVYTVPRFGGVALVDTDCSVTHLSPSEARTNEVLEGQRFYPYRLARMQVNAMQYQNGILNKWFTHEDQLEIAPLPGEDNDQPFTVTTRAGITYVIAAEPWGNAAGIYQIWTIDGRTGDLARYKTSMDQAMLGPRKAANFVEKDNPRVNWNTMSPSEPLPVVRDGTLFWEVRVVPDSAAGVTYTAFVNADTGDVVRYDTDREIKRFIQGRVAEDGTGDDGPTGPDGDLVVVIVDENGNVVTTVPVGTNQSVRVQRRRNATAG